MPFATEPPRAAVAGSRSLEASIFYGIPILQRALAWDGNGEVDQTGLKLRHLWHTSDHFALGLGLTTSVFLLGGHDVFAVEGEAVGRYYAWSVDDLSTFLEFSGGYMQSTDGIPPGGTEWNFTFSFGPGVAVPLERNLDVITGATFHHISNALGRKSPRNPSQNEGQLWLGFSVRL
ncbi:MAG: hypothetical protein ACE5F1_05045 [Planctomycetota bacterium]